MRATAIASGPLRLIRPLTTIAALTLLTPFAVPGSAAATPTATGGTVPASTRSASKMPTANLWVDPSGGACTRAIRRKPYADARACNWQQAYRAARNGDVILVRGGDYGDVKLTPSGPASSHPRVTFRTAPGQRVVVGDFENGHVNEGPGASNVNFVGPVVARTFRSDLTHNVNVDRWRVDCGGCDGVQTFHIEDGRNVLVTNSDIGDNNNAPLVWISGRNLSFVNNRIHDAGLPSGSNAHTECMYAFEVTKLTLRRNHFYHCAVMDVFITGGAVAREGFVENNVFEKPWEETGVVSEWAAAFHFRNGDDPSPDPDDWDFRYNTFVGSLSISPSTNPVGQGGMRVVGNVFLAGQPCGHPNAAYSYNAFVGRGCGSKRVTTSPRAYLAGFVRPIQPGNYALRPRSVLRNKGNPKDRPARDRAGTVRADARPDIGAYEYRAARR